MNAIKCDRCGAFYAVDLFSGVHVRGSEGHTPHNYGYGQQEWDICSPCWDRIYKEIS